jgi:hypothetical protein
MGIDHTRLTYHFSGRDMRLTDVVKNIIAQPPVVKIALLRSRY